MNDLLVQVNNSNQNEFLIKNKISNKTIKDYIQKDGKLFQFMRTYKRDTLFILFIKEKSKMHK